MHNFGVLRWQDVLDIAFVAIAIYYLLVWVKDHRAKQLLHGCFVILVFYAFSYFLQFYTISWLMQKLTTIMLLVLIIVFQPELRQLIEKIGESTRLRKYLIKNKIEEGGYSIQMVQSLVKVIEYFSDNRIGTLIAIEQLNDLEHIKNSGVTLNAEYSAELIVSIFYGRNPLHDGAVILRGNKIASASCLLPLTQSELRDRTLGTRHRAALGLAEASDAIILVTSEETGIISVAKNGKLYRKLSRKRLLEHLLTYLNMENPEEDKEATSSIFSDVNEAIRDIFTSEKVSSKKE